MSKGKPQKIVSPSPNKIPLRVQDPVSYENDLFIWRVNNKYIDIDEPKIGWLKVTIKDLLQKIVQELHSYEGHKWREVRCKPHCHPWKLDEIPTEFYNRLHQRHMDVDELFQISLGGKPRIFGHKDGKIFYLI